MNGLLQRCRGVSPQGTHALLLRQTPSTQLCQRRWKRSAASMHIRAHRSSIYTGGEQAVVQQQLPQQQGLAVHAVVPAWQQQHVPLRHPDPPRGFFSFWLPVLMVFCLTLFSLAASFVAFVLYLRPVLLQAERAARAAEQAALQMDVAAKEMEKAAQVLSGDLPVTFLEMEKASKEFEALGRQLNQWTKLLARTPSIPSPPSSAGSGGEGASGSGADGTRSGIQRVVDDMASLTSARSWIGKWRSRTAAAASGDSDTPVPPLPPSPPRAPKSDSERDQWRIGAPWENPPKKKLEVDSNGEQTALGDAPEAVGLQDPAALETLAGPATDEERAAQAAQFRGNATAMKAAVVAQLKARGGGTAEERAAAAAVLGALDRAQKAAQQAATATGALGAAIERADAKGVLRKHSNGRQ